MTAALRRWPPRAVVGAWLRGSARRPVRGAVVVLGVALMAAAVSAALVGGDLLERLFLADAQAEWGAVDLEVRAEEDSVHELSSSRVIAEEAPPGVVAVLPRLLLGGAVQSGGTAVPDVQVMGLGAEEQLLPVPAAGQDGDVTAALLRLGPEEVLVNQRLARRADVAVGDPLQVVVAVPRWQEDVPRQTDPVVHPPATAVIDATVAGVVADQGTADLHRTANVLLRRDALALATGLEGRVTATHVALADRDPAAAGRAVDGLAHLAAVFDLEVDAVRVDELALAEEDGGLFRSILLTMSALVAVAAALAVRGLVVALAEERGREVATLRALGVRRSGVTRLVTAEGAALGLVGALVGGVAGLPLGQVVTTALVDHFASLNTGRGREQVALTAELDVAPVLLGVAVTLVVVVATARTAGRLVASAGVAEVLRGGALVPVESGPRDRQPVLGIGIGAALVGAGAATGGPLVFIGATVLLGEWWRTRRRRAGDAGRRARVDRRAAGAGLLWALVGAALLVDPAAGVQSGMGVLVVAGLVGIGCGTVLLLPNVRAVARLLRAYLPRGAAQVATAAAAAVAERQRRRTAVTTATVGAVMFMVAALSVLGSSWALPLARQAGGFDVVARSVAPLSANDLRGLPGVATAVTVPSSPLPQSWYGVAADGGPSLAVPYPVRVLGATPELAAAQGFGLADAVEGVSTSTQAIGLVARQRGAAVVDRAALPEGAQVGDQVVIDAGGTPRRLRLIAVLDTYLLRSVVANVEDMAQVVQVRSPDLALIGAAEGVEPEVVADRVLAAATAPGVTAQTTAELRADVIAVNRTFTDTFTALMLAAVVVSTGSVAAQVVRSARERRAELAVLRAVGLRRAAVAATLAAEPVLAAILGCALGLAVGLGLLWALFAVAFGDLPFVVSWARVATVAGGTLALLAGACALAAVTGVPRSADAALRDLG